MRRRVRAVRSVCLAILAAPLAAAAARAAGTIYLERCVGNCVYQQGNENAVLNRSSILTGTRTLSAFGHGDAAWEEHLACVRRAFEPFDVEVTDVNPDPVPHWEVAVAGTPQQAGFPGGTAGVAPYNCGVIQNSIAFSFAAVHGNMLDLCWTTAHEAAHLLGADHLFRAADPMTYLAGCLEKRFTARDYPCGESSPRNCCQGAGGPTQNSEALLRGALGPGAPGGALLLDGFAAFEPPGPVEGASTCRWDDAFGIEAEAPPEAPELRGLACGTAVGGD
jgi:hypothetical protein